MANVNRSAMLINRAGCGYLLYGQQPLPTFGQLRNSKVRQPLNATY